MAAGLATGLTACALPTASARARLQAEVDRTIAALMQEHRIAGMSVAIAAPGLREAFHYGVASRESGHPVTAQTLFEVGSISKVYTGLLGGWAAARGALAWSAPVSQHFAALRGSSFDQATMLDLATYTAGGLPLQMPDAVDDTDKMVAFYRGWRPAFAPGTHRLYSNASIGLFGHLAAQSLGLSFNDAMARTLYPALGWNRA